MTNLTNNLFKYENPEVIIKRLIMETSYFYGKTFSSAIIKKAAEILAGKVELKIK